MADEQFPPDHVPELWEKIPEHIREPLRLYMIERQPVGHFLTAVLTNDLESAVKSADDTNRPVLADIVSYIYNCAPAQCWGSVDKVARWILPKSSVDELK